VKIRQVDETTWIDGAGDQPVKAMSPDLGPGLVPIDSAEVLMPTPYLVVQVRTPAEVAAMTPSMVAGFGDVYVWAWADEGRLVRARFFAPDFGIVEDPAAGSAAVALAARLRDLGHRHGSLKINQGEEIGHPSRINLEWTASGTSIGGTVARDEVRFLKL
jgi:predicted PhzF superfamily epimerase YddE/YHI9